ncbi:UDP-3-O-(3-hydroxymyristoyl)glucosamine N-acyltransferase [Fusobacterium varium]|uniref:UDP-3-O-(3-hydroxymyristoyl)glucosamine N-acyltransferase n=1 Tax=Fusobacterium varium ATCC 27725 TaxID=469618 RepID=A0ABN5JKB4_FUSVA|nr:UDP-3-O-(3-hydroxymyristoyl)glucosamine N-acyltransferase [Fusobacterium varium]AVQ31581.1 UDP-3-O-(3-hydroxymyristoyl)glucosamine N-acyltransferase [Fusobacterium varium ATCC 27725]EES62919.1 putative UDP-3-O-[3-hydroxymyristoyl] glucosamine N-acyltransferase [Fusobacterium varium ATCC 27725]VEH39623.1 UDP-3-O-acylglucosamine N-acyltransferase [Fusobacterium varium]
MKLSELNIGEVIRDSEFDWLGLTAEEYEGRKVLTFLNDEKYIEEVIKNKSITSIITTLKITDKIKNLNIGILISKNPKKDFFELHNKLVEENFYFIKEENKISSKALISPKATIGEYNIEIEENVLIEDNVTIYPNTVIKKNSIIRAGSRIGGNGFEFSRFEDEILSIKSAGKVIIKENVEIQNNNTIDKGVFGETILSKNVKTDNLVHIGHDVIIGENTFLTACVEISGRVKIGKNSYFGPNCTIKNGIIIGENAKITMGAVVTKNVNDNETVTGNFAVSHTDYLKILKFLLKEVE